jgi:hypothetical protein
VSARATACENYAHEVILKSREEIVERKSFALRASSEHGWVFGL